MKISDYLLVALYHNIIGEKAVNKQKLEKYIEVNAQPGYNFEKCHLLCSINFKPLLYQTICTLYKKNTVIDHIGVPVDERFLAFLFLSSFYFKEKLYSNYEGNIYVGQCIAGRWEYMMIFDHFCIDGLYEDLKQLYNNDFNIDHFYIWYSA